MTVLSVQNISKSYGNFHALSNVTLSLEQGHIYGFVGNNGAGKTTLFRILAGLVTPDSGEVALFGETGNKELRLVRRRMGFLLPRDSFSPDMTALNNLVALQKLRGYTDRAEALSLLETAGIERTKASKWKLSSFSTGEFQRTALAACLLGDPELLVLDEPQNGLDPSAVHQFRQFLLSRAEENKTVFISSHILPELYRLATDYIFIHQGRILQTISHSGLEARLTQSGLEGDGGLETYFLRLTGEETA